MINRADLVHTLTKLDGLVMIIAIYKIKYYNIFESMIINKTIPIYEYHILCIHFSI